MADTDTLTRSQRPSVRPAGHSPTTVVGRLVARKAVRSVIVWAYAFAAYVVGSISGFALTYKTQAAREQLARSFGSNVGIQALIGPARHIDSVAGFASWRTSVTLTAIGAIWGLLASTRLLRGEEEVGRWELLAAGQTTRRRAGAQGVAGLAAGWLVLLAVTTIAAVADGRTVHPALSPRACVFYAFSLTCGAAMFLAVGAFTSQLARTRRRAATIAGAVLDAVIRDAGPDYGAWVVSCHLSQASLGGSGQRETERHEQADRGGGRCRHGGAPGPQRGRIQERGSRGSGRRRGNRG